MEIFGQLEFPGDKSLSHRAAILAAMAEGESTIENFLWAEDTLNTLRAMELLGCEVKKDEKRKKIYLNSPGIKGWKSPREKIDVGNSGTGARLLLGLLSGCEGLSARIDGDESLRKRPMGRVCEPLSLFGAQFTPKDFLPIEVHGRKLKDIAYREDLGSAQVKSALILAAIASSTRLYLEEVCPSRDHTENMLRFAGVGISKRPSEQGYVMEMHPPYALSPRNYHIWGDVSSAAFFVVLALLAERGELLIRNVLLNPYRSRYLDILKQMGGNIQILEQKERCGERGGDILVRPSSLRGITIEPKDIPSIIDELPILTIAGVFAEGNFSFRGAKELRVKESDRISALVQNLKALGVEVEEYPDGLSLEGQSTRILKGNVQSFMDHRIVMSFEIAQLKSKSNAKTNEELVKIEGRNWVNTSFPDFYEKLNYLLNPQKPLEDTMAVVTFDGPAGSGKSSLAKKVADKYAFYQIDSGAIYRALTYLALKHYQKSELSQEEKGQFFEFLERNPLILSFNGQRQQLLEQNGQLFGAELRSREVALHIKGIADDPDFRHYVNKLVRQAAEKFPVVVDGRDMGTVVFPEAPLKFFVTATLEVRARRRLAEMADQTISLSELMREIAERDRQDESRPYGSLKPAEDAIFLDTTHYDLDETFSIVEAYLRQCPSRALQIALNREGKPNEL